MNKIQIEMTGSDRTVKCSTKFALLCFMDPEDPDTTGIYMEGDASADELAHVCEGVSEALGILMAENTIIGARGSLAMANAMQHSLYDNPESAAKLLMTLADMKACEALGGEDYEDED